MITREQIHELAQFEDQGACALSFYFQPTTPRNKAHKEEAILTKDLVREALRQLENKSNGSKHKYESARADLDRILRLSQELRGNGAHAKAVFACSAQGFAHQVFRKNCLFLVGFVAGRRGLKVET